MTKLYKFEQILDGYTKPYFHMTGTLEEIMAKWWRNVMSNSLYRYVDSSFNIHRRRVTEVLNKQKVYVEIVDACVYNMGWVTKIEEIKE